MAGALSQSISPAGLLSVSNPSPGEVPVSWLPLLPPLRVWIAIVPLPSTQPLSATGQTAVVMGGVVGVWRAPVRYSVALPIWAELQLLTSNLRYATRLSPEPAV